VSEVLVEIKVYEDDFSQWDVEMGRTVVIETGEETLESVLSRLLDTALDIDKREK